MHDQAVTMSEQWIPVAGGDIRVRRKRPESGAGLPVLFVHGAFVNGHLWDGVIAALGASGEPLDLIAPDLPLGAHQRPMATGTDLTLTGITEMLISVLDALELDHCSHRPRQPTTSRRSTSASCSRRFVCVR